MAKPLFVLFFATALGFLAQNAKAQLSEEIKTAAQIYAFAQVNEDLDMILDMTYPKLVEKAGGAENMKSMIARLREAEAAKGHRLKELLIKDPILSARVGNEIHAIVPIRSSIIVPDGLLTIESSLIAVDTEKRENRYFIETSALDDRNVQKVLTTWDDSLTLPAKKPTVFQDTNKLLE
ncbi:hypothetical protein ADIS_4749 [Lunatimonas lonarensis]|uniref:Nuclear transport factor 2 family protein n=1 Tax=Lunatimonas lonarensis TaxID=1232681 RepID=R7ZL13_9BACT|nr:hypothetical protein [Lunatimonas lonarensis]EON74778.1 hypothetical protein ADIS_4749 [Lunatimonas lonarensis]